MAYLDEARDTADSAADHVLDHNDVHQFINAQRNQEAAAVTGTDYFDDEDFSAYTQVEVSGNAAWAEKYGTLSVRFDGQSSQDMAFLAKTIPSGGAPITLECEVFVAADSPAAEIHEVGIFFSDGVITSSQILGAMMGIDSGGIDVRMRGGTMTSINTKLGDQIAANTWDGNHFSIHLRLTWNSANVWSVYFSYDRVTWFTLSEDNADTMTPTHIGFAVSSHGSAIDAAAYFKNFEVTMADPGAAA